MKEIGKKISRHVKEFHYGESLTWSNVAETLEDVTREEAVHKFEGFNTIAMLSFHIHYYIAGVTEVLEGKPLTIRDKYSFDCPEFKTDSEWNSFKKKMFEVADKFTSLISKLEDPIWEEAFTDEKYGNYFRNFMGLLEHSYYHLGQIVMLKKMIRSGEFI